ncbi:MAG: hypothetical protein JNG83_08610 [Opitutaceae bacterium]|nr:hypothetical protein [Opitutaceae bacterium]
MTGWIGDFFRFWWALLYWNLRKTWFHLRGAERDTCPCQNFSDSGHAFDSRCEAVVHWHKPARFRRVCPLLTETPEGWRCSVDAERVRPFWGRAGLYFAGTVLALYLVGTAGAFVVLRAAGYESSYLSVLWPPRWKEFRHAQEQLYATRAQKALETGNYQEAILSLEIVCRLNPRNYAAGLALAGLAQVSAQANVADHIYERLMRDVPENRLQTAQIWFRHLLARAAYDRIKPLAAVMLQEDPAQRAAWLNGLLFSARQTKDAAFLGAVLQGSPHLPDWCSELIGIEQLLLQGHLERALPRLARVHARSESPYLPYYQIDRLIRHDRADRANELLERYGSRVAPDEAVFLRLRIFHAKGWTALLDPEFENLRQFPLTPRLTAQTSAYLISHPDPSRARAFLDRFVQHGPGLNADSVPYHQAAYLVATLSGHPERAEAIAAGIMKFTASDARGLRGLTELLKLKGSDPRLPRILPLVPLPTEVVYAILERPPPAAAR